MKRNFLLIVSATLFCLSSTVFAFPPTPPGAPTNAQYYMAAANGSLSAEVVPAANVRSILGAADYAAIRSLLDLEAGTDFQALTSVGIYDPTPDTDQTYTCVVCNTGQTAGENLAFGNTVYVAADGKWYKTDSDAEATCSQLDIQVVVTAAGIAADATGTLMSDGWIRDDSFSLSTVGAPLYFQGDTVGDPGWFTETPPSGSGYVVRKMGSTSSTVAVGGMDVIRFKPESSYTVVP